MIILFVKEGKKNFRMAGQMLPGGSIPVAVIDYNRGHIFEIFSEISEKEILQFANTLRKELIDNNELHNPENNIDFIPPQDGWTYDNGMKYLINPNDIWGETTTIRKL